MKKLMIALTLLVSTNASAKTVFEQQLEYCNQLNQLAQLAVGFREIGWTKLEQYQWFHEHDIANRVNLMIVDKAYERAAPVTVAGWDAFKEQLGVFFENECLRLVGERQ